MIDEIFATSDKDKALALIKEHHKMWEAVIGGRGNVGKKAVNAHTQAGLLFDGDIAPTKKEKGSGSKTKAKPIILTAGLFDGLGDEADVHHIDDSGLDESMLNNLEEDSNV